MDIISFSVILMLLIVGKSVVQSCSRDELILVQMITRYGDTAPSMIYPEDPNPSDVWREELGDLTMRGKFQAYALGCYLRGIYEDFITSNPNEVSVLSAPEKYCIKSAQSFVTALYAPSTEWDIVQDFPWQPIYIEYGNFTDAKFLGKPDCPSAEDEVQKILDDQAKLLDSYEDLFNYWQVNSGWNFKNLSDVELLYSTVKTEAKYNLSIPIWVQTYWNYMQQLHDFSYSLKVKGSLQRRLRGGPLVAISLDKMKKAIEIENEKRTKVFVYATHGINLASYLSSLGMWNNLEPEPCATVIIELYRHGEEHLVRFLYLNSTTPEREPQQFYLLTVPGCREYCSLDYLQEYTKDIVPENWERECKLL